MWDKSWSSNVHDIIAYHLVIAIILSKVLDEKTYILPIITGPFGNTFSHPPPQSASLMSLNTSPAASPPRKGPSLDGPRYVKGQLQASPATPGLRSSLGGGDNSSSNTSLVGYGLTETSAALLEATLTFVKLVHNSFQQVQEKSKYYNTSTRSEVDIQADHDENSSAKSGSRKILKLRKPLLFSCKTMNESIMSGVITSGIHMNTLEQQIQSASRLKLQASLELLSVTDATMLVTTGDYMHQVI